MTDRRLALLLFTSLLVSGVSLGGWSTPKPGLAQDSVDTTYDTAYQGDVEDVSVFYEPLAPFGTWMELPEYGRVWSPHGVPARWRPYTAGRWVYTEHGWTWVSDREWGWAPFHYGRWTFVGAHGWVWVPGTVWGPAWVVWRHAPGWVGWAPLPPQAVFRPGIGLSVANIDVHIRPSWFCFVEERHILSPRVVRYITPPTRNTALIHVTQNVTHYTVIQNRVVDRSIPVKRIESVIARPVPRMRVVETRALEAMHRDRVREREREVVMFRPPAPASLRTTLPDAHPPRHTSPAQRTPDTTFPQPPQDAHRRLQEQQIRERAAVEERQRQDRERAAVEEKQRQVREREALEEKQRQVRERAALEDKQRQTREREALEERQRQTRERAVLEERQRHTPQPQSQSVSPEEIRRRDEAQQRALEDKARRDRQTREQQHMQQQLQQQMQERQRVVQPQQQPQPPAQFQPQAQPRPQPQGQQPLQPRQEQERRTAPQQQLPQQAQPQGQERQGAPVQQQPPSRWTPPPQGVPPQAYQQQRATPQQASEEEKERRKKQQTVPQSQQP